jgi:hypothetical protein
MTIWDSLFLILGLAAILAVMSGNGGSAAYRAHWRKVGRYGILPGDDKPSDMTRCFICRKTASDELRDAKIGRAFCSPSCAWRDWETRKENLPFNHNPPPPVGHVRPPPSPAPPAPPLSPEEKFRERKIALREREIALREREAARRKAGIIPAPD